MAGDDLKTTVRVDSTYNDAGVKQAEAAVSKLESRVNSIQAKQNKLVNDGKTHLKAYQNGQEQLKRAEESLGAARKKLSDERLKGEAAYQLAITKTGVQSRKIELEAEARRAETARKAKKDDLEARDRKKALANEAARISNAEATRVDRNRREESGNHRRNESALTRRLRQIEQLNTAEVRSGNLLQKASALLGYKGEIERRQGSEAVRNFKDREKAAGDLYRTVLNSTTGTSAAAERTRLLARDHYTRSMTEARGLFQTETSLARASQAQFNRDIRERERAYERLKAQVSQGYGQFRSGASQAVSAGRMPAIYAGVAAGASLAAAAKGISSRTDVDSAETALRIFGDNDGKKFTQSDVVKLRNGGGGQKGLDQYALETGNTSASALRAYTELNKQGIKDPRGNTELLLRATTGLELDREQTTKLMGLVDRNLGAKSTPDRMHSVLNSVAVAAKEDPSQAPEIVEGMKRGFGALSRGNMTPEQLAALVSGGQSVGIQPGKAGTFIDALTQELAEGQYARGQRKKDLNKAAQMFGFGNARNMAHMSSTDSYGTILQVFERMQAMSPEQRAKASAFLSQRQWSGEDLQMVQGLSGMKSTYAKIVADNAKSKDDRLLESAFQEKMSSLDKQWQKSKAIFSRFWEAFGAGFEDIYRQVNTYFFESGIRFDWTKVSNHVKGFLEGFINGLGFKDIRGLLESAFGTPGKQNADYVEGLKSFGKGLGQGLKSVFEAIKGVMLAFTGGSQDPETIGNLTGKIIGLSGALLLLSPVIGVLGGLASIITAIAGAAKMMTGLTGLLGMSRAGGMAGTAAEGGLLAKALTGAGGGIISRVIGGLGLGIIAAIGSYRGEIATLLGAPQIGQMIWDGIKSMLSEVFTFLRKQLSLKGIANLWKKSAMEFVPAPVERWMNGEAEDKQPKRDSSFAGNQKVIDESIKTLEELNRTIAPNTKAIEDNTKAVNQKQSYEDSGSFRGLIQNASFSSSDAQSMGARFQLAAISRGVLTPGGVGSGGAGSVTGTAGVPYTPGGGGASLYGNTPGQSFSTPGVGARYGMGGSGSSNGNQGGSRSWRNNNPGNLKYGAFAARMGATGKDEKGFATFPSYEAGRKAQEQLLFGSDAYKNLSIGDAIRKYAPGSDGNDPTGYAAQMARAAGVGIGTRLSDLTPDQRQKFLDAQQAKEGWKVGTSGNPVSNGGGVTGPLTTDGPIRANLMHGQYGAPGQNLGRLTTGNGKSALVNNAALPSFDGFVKELEAQGYNVQSLGGFNNRMIRGGSKLSQHAYGNAIDLNPGKNPLGTTMTDMPDNVRALAKKYGLIWGMDWKGRKDPMHFEWNGTRPWLEGKALADKAGTMLGQGTLKADKDMGDGMKTSGWQKATPESLAKETPAERLAREAPSRSGGMGRGGSSVHAPITIHNNGDAEHTANQVQRRIQDSTNYLPHDISFESV